MTRRIENPSPCGYCNRRARARGLCPFHYQRWNRGLPIEAPPIPTDTERFWAKVNKTDGCWLWTATVNRDGYGLFSLDGRMVSVHRHSYMLAIGPIPDGLEIDHLCRTRACVNPSHMEAVPRRENVRRSENPAGVNARKTHCKNGHPLSGANLGRQADGGRRCKACALAASRRRRAKLDSVKEPVNG